MAAADHSNQVQIISGYECRDCGAFYSYNTNGHAKRSHGAATGHTFKTVRVWWDRPAPMVRP